ncbi:MAG TPA: hypothetical protein VJA20_00185 [Candidatus Nanoarchaeia archaeon]|nr:hypothetical protein [Candidatus Nanoarchaeia archaeon]
MTYENINKIKNELFGNLEVRIIKNPTNSEEVIFERKMIKSGKPDTYYVSYNLKDNAISQVTQYNAINGGTKVFYKK